MNADFAKFHSHALFAVMDPAAAEGLFGQGQVRLLPADKQIWRSGEPASQIHLVLAGMVEQRAGGETASLHKAGDTLGEEESLTGQPHLHDARTLAVTRLLSLPTDSFIAYLDGHPDLVLSVISHLAADLRTKVREIALLKLQSTTERLARYLCGLAVVETGPALVQLRLEKRQLAAELGMDPATLSRAFAKLRDCGVDARNGHNIAITDLARLRLLCGLDEGEQ